ncbi:MAG: transporter substrate-binding domain-containing protein [Clostridia bacterium]|nr:transporter substrate-binding domain-containing protein [Clostridia bacterium]
MKKILTFILTAMLLVSACFGLTACGNSTVVDPRKGNTIVVGYTVYEPMNYTEDKVLVGFDTELAIMTFEALGYNVQFKCITWENKYIDLTEEVIDCIWNGFTSNGTDKIDNVETPRDQLVDFSYNYMQNAQCILRKSTTAEITDTTQFNGKNVAVERGSSGASLAKSYKTENVNININELSSQMDAITKLNEGLCDYAIVDVLLANAILEQSAYSDLVLNQSVEIGVEYYAIGFAKGSELTAKVNATLEFFAQTGYLQKLATKYNLATSVITDFSSQK